MGDYDETIPDESEQLDQLQPVETLIDRGLADSLDEGYTAPERWSVAEGFGNTPAEMAQGETLEQRMAQEEPEADAGALEDWRQGEKDREVGSARAGRLVAASGDSAELSDMMAEDVGIDGGAACAEEAAMHIVDEDDEMDDEDDRSSYEPKAGAPA